MYPLYQYKLPFLYQLTNLSLFFFKKQNVCLPLFHNLECITSFDKKKKKKNLPLPPQSCSRVRNPYFSLLFPFLISIAVSGRSVSMYIYRNT